MNARILGVAICIAVAGACSDDPGTNQPPTVSGTPVTTAEDTPVTVTFTASDPDGDPLTFRFSAPMHGAVTGTGPSITYTPTADFHGTDAITASVSDGTNPQVTATITISVTPVADPPVAVDDSLAGAEDTVTSVPVATLTANDTDADGDTLTVTAVAGGVHGSASLSGGMVRFTPEPDFIGAAGFDYTVSDGTATDTGHVDVDVGPTNDAPVAVDDARTTAEDAALTVTAAALVANDTDAENQTLSVTAVGNPSHGTVDLTGGTVTFTPAADYNGPASFEYTVSDGLASDVGTVAVTVTPVPDPPIAVDDAATIAEDTPLVIAASALAANDSDPDGTTPVITAVGGAADGTVSLVAGTVTFTPMANLTGTTTFTYTLSDGALTDTGTVTVTITPVPDAPIAADDTATTAEDTPLTLPGATLTFNDVDVDGPALTVTAVAGATHGTASVTANVVTFTPAADYNGPAGFDYTVSDGALSDTAHVTLTITPVPDPPIAVDDAAATAEDTPLTLAATALAANDRDPDGTTPTVTAVGNPSHGTVGLAGGTVTFTPAADYNGPASFDYTLSDGALTDTGTVAVTVSAVNDRPVAVAQTVSTSENTPLVITLTATDVDSASVTFAAGPPTAGSLGPIAPAGPLSATVTYTPPAGFDGSASFTFTASDGALTSTPATVAITVVNVPVCNDGLVETPEQCDDQGNAPGDGCSATCTVEAGWTCTGAPSACDELCGDTLVVGGEACDDGNSNDTDGCTTQCRIGRLCTAAQYPTGDRFVVDAATGTCYVGFDSEPLTWASAEAACVSAGGYLATITSAGEQGLVTAAQSDAETAWIGGQDDANDTDTVFRWITGEAWGFTAFAPGQPDDDVASGGNGECLRLDDALGRWADTNCAVASAQGRVCEFPLVTCGDGVIEPGETCDDRNTVGFDGCSATCKTETVFFSEYVEGTSLNKAIEIANPSLTAASLTGCQVRVYSNGAATASSTITLTAGSSIASHDVYVLCNNTAVSPQCDQTSGNVNWNGDDAIDLVCGVTTIDVFGKIGEDPGTNWGSGATATIDRTLRRKCSVSSGDPIGTDTFDPAIEWDGFATDTFAGLGTLSCP